MCISFLVISFIITALVLNSLNFKKKVSSTSLSLPGILRIR